MAEHCYVKNENGYHIAPHPYVHISRNFFEVAPSALELISKNIAGIIGDFKENYLKAIEGHLLNETFVRLKSYIDNEEPRWISEVEGYVKGVRQEVLKLYPLIESKNLRAKMLDFIDSGNFVPLISMAIIFDIAQSLKIKMTDQEHVEKGYLLPLVFPLAVGFYQWICHRIVADNIDLQNQRSRQTRWNWRWDYEVSFLINDHLLNGRKVFLVTSDKDIIKMLKEYGFGGRVMNLDLYLEFLDV